MTPFIIHDQDGRIIAQGACPAKIIHLQETHGGTIVQGTWDWRETWFDNGTPTPRPQIDMPETHTIAADTTWTIAGVPAGTEVLTDGVIVGTTDGSDLDLTFPETGTWRVDLRPPFPWRDAACEVTVT